VVPLWPKNYTLEVVADQQKILHYWTKYAFLEYHLQLTNFLPRLHQNPVGVMPPSLVLFFSAHWFFFVDISSHFEVTHFRLMADWQKFSKI